MFVFSVRQFLICFAYKVQQTIIDHSYNWRIQVEDAVMCTQLSMFRAISNLTENKAQ